MVHADEYGCSGGSGPVLGDPRHQEPASFRNDGAGAALYAIGFGMFGFISAYSLFILAALVITLGEMIVEPISQALAANFAPPDMRGRYMAVFGLSSIIPTTIGPGLPV